MHTVAAVAVVAIVASVLCVSVTARPTPPAFCQDPPSLHFCSVLPGQGVPLPAPISDDDTVDVWVLQAPVWEFIPLLGNITKELKLIHTAIGLVVNSTGAEYSFEAEGLFESPNVRPLQPSSPHPRPLHPLTPLVSVLTLVSLSLNLYRLRSRTS